MAALREYGDAERARVVRDLDAGMEAAKSLSSRTPFPDPVFVPSLAPVGPMSSWREWVVRNEATFRAHPKFTYATVDDIAAELAGITRPAIKLPLPSPKPRTPNRAERRAAMRKTR